MFPSLSASLLPLLLLSSTLLWNCQACDTVFWKHCWVEFLSEQTETVFFGNYCADAHILISHNSTTSSEGKVLRTVTFSNISPRKEIPALLLLFKIAVPHSLYFLIILFTTTTVSDTGTYMTSLHEWSCDLYFSLDRDHFWYGARQRFFSC